MKRQRRNKQINVRIDAKTLAALKLIAIQHGVTASEFIRHEILKAARKAAA